MATAPYGVRLLVGAAVTAIEETLKLPQTIAMYPMTLASNLAQIAMKMQQDLADLAIKGDSALEGLFPPQDEQPEWATFDEDDADNPAPWPGDGARRTEGRFALYSVTDDEDPETTVRATTKAATTKAPTTKLRTAKAPTTRTARKSTPGTPATPAVVAPPIAVELDYESLTLAQLRARMPSLSVTDLRALLAYEEAAKSRAPFQTLLANRITRATAK
ncbi:MAG: lipid droplet-associated protein [Mycobacterium sp.]